MTMIDFLVYFFLFFILPMHLYLKKTGKTFIEVAKEVADFFKELGGSNE